MRIILIPACRLTRDEGDVITNVTLLVATTVLAAVELVVDIVEDTAIADKLVTLVPLICMAAVAVPDVHIILNVSIV